MGSDQWGIKIPGGYFDEAKHLYRNEQGTSVPSTTGVFDILGCADFSMIKPDVLEWKRLYGGGLHKGIELLAFQKLDWDSVDDILIPAITGIEQWLKAVKFEPVAAEERRIITLNSMQFGGSLDLRGSLLYKGVRRSAILDEKTGSKYSKTWEWQLGGYIGGAPKPESGSYVGVDLQVDMDGKVTPHWVPDTLKAQREFCILLAAANLKLNAGLAKIKGIEEE
jgi:hypothetical protein